MQMLNFYKFGVQMCQKKKPSENSNNASCFQLLKPEETQEHSSIQNVLEKLLTGFKTYL